MSESYAGITVPEGEPETIRDAAQTFTGVGGGLEGAGADLRSIPGLVSDWQGPASSSFGGTVVTNGSCVDDGAAAMTTCAHAARTYADALDHAQEDARKAIHDARDAQRRIDEANADIEAALGAQTQASNDITVGRGPHRHVHGDPRHGRGGRPRRGEHGAVERAGRRGRRAAPPRAGPGRSRGRQEARQSGRAGRQDRGPHRRGRVRGRRRPHAGRRAVRRFADRGRDPGPRARARRRLLGARRGRVQLPARGHPARDRRRDRQGERAGVLRQGLALDGATWPASSASSTTTTSSPPASTTSSAATAPTTWPATS